MGCQLDSPISEKLVPSIQETQHGLHPSVLEEENGGQPGPLQEPFLQRIHHRLCKVHMLLNCLLDECC